MKTKLALFIVSILLLIPSMALSADLLWRLTHDDQDSLVLGEIQNVNANTVSVKVEYIVSGDWTAEEITVKKPSPATIERLGGIKQGERFLLSLDKGATKYAIKWGMYKVRVTEENLIEITAPENPDNPAIAFYINSAGKIRDFSFDNKSIFIRDGERLLQIHPNLDPEAKKYEIHGISRLKKPGSPFLGFSGTAVTFAAIWTGGFAIARGLNLFGGRWNPFGRTHWKNDLIITAVQALLITVILYFMI